MEKDRPGLVPTVTKSSREIFYFRNTLGSTLTAALKVNHGTKNGAAVLSMDLWRNTLEISFIIGIKIFH